MWPGACERGGFFTRVCLYCQQSWLLPLSTIKEHKAKSPAKEAGLRFGTNGNAKLAKGVWHFSIASGVTCPGASTCKALVQLKTVNGKQTRKLVEGPDATLRCFSAVQELAFPSLHNQRLHNLRLLTKAGSADKMKALILDGLSPHASMVRVHIGGDFFSQAYFDAWMEVAKARPATTFYAYTKSIPFWKDYLHRYKKLPGNFKLVASLGGKFDHLVDRKKMVWSTIVFHPEEARKMNLPIEDADDTLAQKAEAPFALVLHAQQKAGSPAAAAIKRMRDEGTHFGYGRHKKS